MNASLEPHHVDALVRQLARRYPRVDIATLVAEELDRLRDARVTAYVPILVERAVVARLGRATAA